MRKLSHRRRHRTVHRPLSKKRIFAAIFLPLTIIALLWVFVISPISSYGKSLKQIGKKPYKSVCGLPAARAAKCNAKVITNDQLKPLAYTSPPLSAINPLQLHNAYNLPCAPGGTVSAACATPATYGPVVAIVDAYHTPTIESDLNVYSQQFGLPPCTKANGCLQVVDQNGGSALPTGIDQSWALEATLDVQAVHAVCQTCKILLVETNTNMYSDLTTGVNTAARLGAVAISNSYGSVEFSTQSTFDPAYNHPGVAVVVSSGDSGYGASYPASSTNVISVGGTTLQMYTDSTYAGETVWSGSGSGCSSYESALPEQMAISNWSRTGCQAKRAIADISAVADPNTGLAIYSTTPYSGQTGWWQIGGTSLSAPIIAASFALANNTSAPHVGSYLYQNYQSANFHDITAGSNGSCGTAMCAGGAGYDGPTGLGTLKGVGAFGGAIPTVTTGPSPTAVPTSVPPPSTTPTSIPPTSTPAPTITPFPTATPIPTFSITGSAYLDTNRNGIRDAGESPFVQQVISLDPPALPGQWTDSNGTFAFNNIPAGTYTVTLILAPTSGYIPTTPNPVTLTVGPSGEVNFGIYPPQPPYISGTKVSNITKTSVTISYTTAAPGTTGVLYGLRKNTLNKSGPYNDSMVTSHVLTVTGLTANTTYYYKVYSQDGPYMQYSPVLTFKTARK